MKAKLLFSYLIFSVFTILSFGQTPGVPIFDTSGNEYIEYIPGNLPIIISAPHGGVKQSGSTVGGVFYPDNDSSLPDRSCGTNERDDNTDILIRRIQDEIFAQTGCYAHVVINNLHRSKLDPNREINEATCGDSDSQFYWNAWLLLNVVKQTALWIAGCGGCVNFQDLGVTNAKPHESIVSVRVYCHFYNFNNTLTWLFEFPLVNDFLVHITANCPI